MVEHKHEGMPKFVSDTGNSLAGTAQPSALYANLERHPAEKMGAGAFEADERRALQMQSVQYGSHMAMRTVIERNIFAQHQRMGGNGSAFALQSHMGRMYTLDETDYLNDPRESVFLDKQGIHSRVEKVYGLWAQYPYPFNKDEITKFKHNVSLISFCTNKS